MFFALLSRRVTKYTGVPSLCQTFFGKNANQASEKWKTNGLARRKRVTFFSRFFLFPVCYGRNKVSPASGFQPLLFRQEKSSLFLRLFSFIVGGPWKTSTP